MVNEDVWEDSVELTKNLIRTFCSTTKKVEKMKEWKKFSWFRKQVRILDRSLHQLPHAGKISPVPELSKSGDVAGFVEVQLQ